MYQLQIVINLIEHIPNMYALMIGRILGGLSTSLLFSAFESWMVSEHRWIIIFYGYYMQCMCNQ